MLWLLFALTQLDRTNVGVALDADAVYLLGAHVVRVDKATGASIELAAAIPMPTGLAVDDRDVFFATGMAILRVAKTGGPIESVAPAVDAHALASAGDWIYFIDGDAAIARVPKAGGKPEVLWRANAGQLALASGRVWWTTTAERETPHSRDTIVVLRSAPLGGGPARYEGGSDVRRLLAVGDRLVWSDASDVHVGNYLIRGGFWLLGGFERTIVVAKDGHLLRVTLPAGDPDVPTLVDLPASNPLPGDFAAFTCAVDASGVYYVSSWGTELDRF